MGLKDFVQGRRDSADMGQGVWRRAHDRFRRGLDRFHQILERVDDEASLDALIPAANRLADLLPEVRGIATGAQRVAPSDSTDVPASREGHYADLHRALSKAGNSLALCAEALAMMRCDGACAGGCSKVESVERRVVTVEEQVAEAARLLRLVEGSGESADGDVSAA
ncbi:MULTISPECIES: dehydrogenase [Micrococcaceae]|uniref:dehydrogenase n=1 Tax=unclassified Kocuria TaxID=2649579 RepID=UPI001EDFCE48|nr:MULTISPECIES: dehydrogenase [unclassified Kocuria]